MLEAQESTEEDGHLVIETEEGSGTEVLLHEGKIGLKEEGIVIISN